MGFAGLARSLAADARRHERESRRRAREAEKAWHAAEKANAAESARLEVAAFEAHLDEMTSMHRESGDRIDWSAVAVRVDSPQPVAVALDRARSTEARAAVEGYTPGFFERLFGLTGRRTRLEAELAEATSAEQVQANAAHAIYEQKTAAWRESCESLAEARALATRLLAGDVAAYGDAVRATACLNELMLALGASNLAMTLNEHRAELTLHVDEDSVVPLEQKTLTARGGLSAKKLPAAKRMEIYQDYVCGSALRAAREILAVTPLPLVLVHVEANQVDTASGHIVARTILSVACPREALARANWDRVDASDFVGSLLHRMKVSRGKGFAAVEPLVLQGGD